MIDTLFSAIDNALTYLLFWAVIYPVTRFTAWLADGKSALAADKRAAVDAYSSLCNDALVVGHLMAMEMHEEELSRALKRLGIDLPEA